MSPRRRTTGGVTALVLAVLALVVYLYSARSDPAAAPPGGAGHVPAGTLGPRAAAEALASLRVADKGRLTGYKRQCGEEAGCVFGPAWADVDHNGCDQRNDVLRRDLTGVRVRAGTHDCIVLSGTLDDPYTGTAVQFTKDDAGEVPIDHVVPLAAAWTQGAARWSREERTAFANDLGNLLATTRAENSAKGDSTAEEWVPGNPAYRCSYARVMVTVKQRYHLTVTAEEAAALRSLLARC